MDIQQINALDLKQMKSMKNYSLYMVQWGWLIGVLACFGSFASFSKSVFFEAFSLLTFGISHWYFWTRCRTEQAKTCALVDSVFLMVASGIMICKGMPVFIIFLIIGVMLFRGAQQQLLWGESRITYPQLKVAYAARQAGMEVDAGKLPAIEECNPTSVMVAIVLVYIADGLSVLDLLKSIR